FKKYRIDRVGLTLRAADDRRLPMQKLKADGAAYGPWLVGLGAALWGTESAWRIPLNELFDARVIVFWDHVRILIMFLPILILHLHEVRRIRARTWGHLLFSGFAGSAVDAIFFTVGLQDGRAAGVNGILKVELVISHMGAIL